MNVSVDHAWRSPWIVLTRAISSIIWWSYELKKLLYVFDDRKQKISREWSKEVKPPMLQREDAHHILYIQARMIHILWDRLARGKCLVSSCKHHISVIIGRTIVVLRNDTTKAFICPCLKNKTVFAYISSIPSNSLSNQHCVEFFLLELLAWPEILLSWAPC